MTRRLLPIAGFGLMTAGIAACGGPSGAPEHPAPGSPPPGATSAPGAPVSSAPAAPGSPAPGAVPAACDFRVGETCYATDTEACNAAGCKQGSCIVLESYPAQVSCK